MQMWGLYSTGAALISPGWAAAQMPDVESCLIDSLKDEKQYSEMIRCKWLCIIRVFVRWPSCIRELSACQRLIKKDPDIMC